MRIFTAVYPSAEASAHLDLALASVGGPLVGDPGKGVRWTPKEQRHVTIAFHGEVPDGAVPHYVDELTAAVAGIEPFECLLAGGGTFQGRTFFVGVGEQGGRGLRALADAAEEAAAVCGFRADPRSAGRPHLTLARATARAEQRRRGSTDRGGRRRPLDGPDIGAMFELWTRALSVYRGPAWTVDAVSVVQSELGAGASGGPLHTEVARIVLDDGATSRW